MSLYLTDAQLKVLINTIGAVETGGQVYGKQRYNAFASPYKNTPSEHSSTAGAFQEFGENLRQLLLQIQKEYPSVFKKYDTANISKDISGKAWSASNPYKVYSGTTKANAIIAIISSKEGIIIQDKRIAELIEKYLKYIVEELKVTNTQAAMFLAQCEHLGGKTPLKRIVDRASNKNSIDSLYTSLLKDQNDKSNNNQIGDKIFQTRHEKALKWIKEKVSSTDVVNTVKQTETTTPSANKGSDTKMTVNDLINKLISVFKSEDGYLEKASNSNLDSKKANAGSRNYTKYWRDLANWGLGNYQAQYWCAAFIHWCFVKAFGLANAKKLLLHAPYINCQTGYEKFKAKGQVYSSPKIGDIVVFWNGSRYSHTEFVIGVNGNTFSTCGGNTAVSGAVANGGGVFYGKTYTLNTSKHKFLRPDYASILGSVSITPTTTPSSSTTASKVSGKIDTVKEVQKWLNSNYKAGLEADGIYGAKTKKAIVKALQTELNQTYKAGLVVDGIWGSKTRAAIRSLSVGSNNDVVKVLQAALVCNGYSSAYVDGEYGNGTASAVKSYQSKKGLSADGIAGQQTFESLCK